LKILARRWAFNGIWRGFGDNSALTINGTSHAYGLLAGGNHYDFSL